MLVTVGNTSNGTRIQFAICAGRIQSISECSIYSVVYIVDNNILKFRNLNEGNIISEYSIVHIFMNIVFSVVVQTEIMILKRYFKEILQL